MSDYGTAGAAVFGGFANGILGRFAQRDQMELLNTQYNRLYSMNEQLAQNADKRTRALYNDFYSPQALLKQYKETGLSPSMMFGGTPGQGGMSGAQGSVNAGVQSPIFNPQSILEGAMSAAQIANINAQTQKTKAETRNVESDTNLKELEKQFQQMNLGQYESEWNIINTAWEDENGNQTSLFEMADKHYRFESFLEEVRKDEATGRTNFKASTEAEIKQLRTIFESASRFHRDISVLSEENVNANFQIGILNKLNEKGFQDLNAEAAVAQLQQSIATNELTTQQKNAWNNLINRLGKQGSTMKDVVIVLGMILGNFASHTGIKLNLGSR